MNSRKSSIFLSDLRESSLSCRTIYLCCQLVVEESEESSYFLAKIVQFIDENPNEHVVLVCWLFVYLCTFFCLTWHSLTVECPLLNSNLTIFSAIYFALHNLRRGWKLCQITISPPTRTFSLITKYVRQTCDRWVKTKNICTRLSHAEEKPWNDF